MKMLRKRLLCLNLALLTALVLALPAAAAEPADLRASRIEDAEPAELQAAATFYITVNGTRFLSNAARSGTGWSYDPVTASLTLRDYDSGPIRASGDLRIYSFGTTTVTGTDGNYGQAAILGDTEIDLFVQSGSFTARGGNGVSKGGDAISASQTLCSSKGTALFVGGNATGNSALGGDAIHGKSLVYLSGSGITARGGKSSRALGGCGVISGYIYIMADAELYGGANVNNASYGGPAVYGNNLRIGYVDARFVGSGTDAFSIKAGSPNYDETHCKLTGSGYTVTFRTNRYTLTLHDPVSGEQQAFTQRYPDSVDLGEHRWTRSGAEQVGWAASPGGEVAVALNKLYVPAMDTLLYAVWQTVKAGDILLIGMGGRFSDGKHYRLEQGSAELPAVLSGYEGDVLGWCESYPEKHDTPDVFGGVWHAPNTTVASEGRALTLYAADDCLGSYIVYHPNGGSVTDGGDIVVQGISSTNSDLLAYALGGERFTAPEGYVFKGWNGSATGTTASVKPGSGLSLREGARHLYAVWEKSGEPEVVHSGPYVRVTIPSGYAQTHSEAIVLAAVYDDGGKMIAAEKGRREGGQPLTLTLSCGSASNLTCAICLTDDSFRPLTERAVKTVK